MYRIIYINLWTPFVLMESSRYQLWLWTGWSVGVLPSIVWNHISSVQQITSQKPQYPRPHDPPSLASAKGNLQQCTVGQLGVCDIHLLLMKQVLQQSSLVHYQVLKFIFFTSHVLSQISSISSLKGSFSNHAEIKKTHYTIASRYRYTPWTLTCPSGPSSL